MASTLELSSSSSPRSPAGRFFAHPVVGAALVLAVYMACRRQVWGGLTRVPERVFEGTSIFWRALLEKPLFAGVMAACVVVAFLGRKTRWRDLDVPALRVFMGTVLVVQTWLTVGAEHNLYFDRSWAIDRVIVLLVAALSLWRPAFSPFVLALSLVFSAQATAALNALGWTERRLFLDVQMVFASFLALRALGVRANAFVFVALCTAAASYAYPGINKLQIGERPLSWVLEDDLSNLFVSSWVTGWARWWSADEAASVAAFLHAVALPLTVLTLVFELAGIVVFAHRRLTLALLALWPAMHVFIFLSSGILFWKWIVVDLSLAACLVLAARKGFSFSVWPWWQRLAGTVVLLFSQHTLEPSKLGWWDTRLTQAFRVEAVDEKGNASEISPLFFTPYDLPFVQDRLHDFVGVQKTTSTFGAVMNQKLYERLQKTRTIEEARAISGDVARAGPKRAEPAFQKFMTRTFSSWRKYKGKPPGWWLPHPPHHIHHAPGWTPWDGAPPATVRVRMMEGYYDGARILEVEGPVVAEIDVRGPPPRGARKAEKKPARTAPVPVPAARPPAPVVDRGADLVFKDACAPADVVTLGFLGDFAFHRSLQTQAWQAGYESLWGDVLDVFRAADVTWANVEGTIASGVDADGRDVKDPGRVWDDVVYSAARGNLLNFHPDLAAAFVRAGVDVASTVNNHSLDRGALGVERTREALTAAGLTVTGTRVDDEPWFAITDSKGMRLAWVACTEWSNVKTRSLQKHILNCTEQRDDVLALVRELAARTDVDAVIATPHGGLDNRLVIDERLRKLAEDLADAGATVVATANPHHMQGWEKRTTPDGREVPLVWGRGNFLTYEDDVEYRASAVVFIGLAKDSPSSKARAVGAGHVPILLELLEQDKDVFRKMVVLDRGNGDDVQLAERLALTRFGAARRIPATAPLTAVDVRPACRAAAAEPPPPPALPGARASEACKDDGDCAAGLACASLGEGLSVCTAACEGTCSVEPGAICASVPAFAAPACWKPCTDPEVCTVGTRCMSAGGQRVCAPP